MFALNANACSILAGLEERNLADAAPGPTADGTMDPRDAAAADSSVADAGPAESGQTRSTVAVAGGADEFGGSVTEVYSAALDANGDLRDWMSGPSLPMGKAFAGSFAMGRTWYLAAGLIASTSSTAETSTFWSTVAEDGRSLSAWAVGQPFPTAISRFALAQTVNFAFVSGGFDGARALASVYMAPLGGSRMGSFVAGRPLPEARARASAAATSTHLFVMGGDNEGVGVLPVLSARIGLQGDLDPWVTVGMLPEPRSLGCAVAVADVVYFIGGETVQRARSDRVWRFRTKPDGSITIDEMPALQGPRSLHSCVAANGVVHVLGGRPDTAGATTSTSSSRIDASGALGPWQSSKPLPAPRQLLLVHAF